MFYGIEKKYKWYIILRLIIVLSILLSGLVTLRRGIEFNFIPLLIIILMSVIGNFIFYTILKKYTIKKGDLYIQLIFDNLLVFVIIYYTGGSTSVFNILYFINIISSSYFLFTRGGIVLAILSMFNYSTILLGEYYGFLISPYNIGLPQNLMLENILMKIYINSFSYIIIAVLSGILSEKIQLGKQEILKFRLKLKDIINNITSGIIICNSSFKITDYNKQAKKIFNTIKIEKNIFNIDNSIFNEGIFNENYAQFKKNNYYYDLKVEKMYYKNKFENYILIINDITTLKKLEKQLIEKERLSVIGELSASIAHEIRNPLSSIKGSIKILQEDLGENINNHPMFNIILEEIERLNKLINDFLFYSKKTKIKKQTVFLKKLLENIIYMIDLKEMVTFENINNDTIIFSDENKIKQVFINLLKNAKEAKNNKDLNIKIVFSYSNKYDIIEIKDNGKKMEEEIKGNLFKPFNSDKQSGTGLGLAVVYKIVVEEHNGKIEFFENNGYKTFKIMIPRSNDD